MRPFSDTAVRIFLARFDELLAALGYAPSEIRVTVGVARRLLADDRRASLVALGRLLARSGVRARWNRMLEQERGPFLARLIAPHSVGDVLDLLSGNGLVALSLGRLLGCAVETVERAGCDCAPAFPGADREFSVFKAAPPANAHDTVLLCTVLHHEWDPRQTLELAVRAARRRVVLVENCIDAACPADYQEMIDLLFNESLNKTLLPSPCSHRTAEGWMRLCAAYGATRHVASAPAAPGIPLSHDVLVIEKTP